MSAIADLFQQAQLAEASYANFLDANGHLITSNAGVTSALINVGFSVGANGFSSQATAFVADWQVIDQYTAPGVILGIGGTGFSATLFKNNSSGEYVFALRGTEPGVADLLGADFGDIVFDGLALDQIVDM